MLFIALWIAIQIITESFPISSSTHVVLLEKLTTMLGYGDWINRIPDHFDDVLHFPTLCVLAYVFWPRWTAMVRMLWYHWQRVVLSLLKTGSGVFVTIVLYGLFIVIGKEWFPLQLGLSMTLGLLLSLRWVPRNAEQPYTMIMAFILGLVQGIALLPGLSRLGTTYVVARWLRLSVRDALEISFVFQVPLIIPAVARGLVSVYKSPFAGEVLNGKTLLVMLVAGVVAYKALLWTMELARSGQLWKWSFYMILPLVMSMLI
ncbi:undecaprenyl-diphosphate phosphatase [Candidatus Babeliales bacterium]|nr:undecaprenyl-diphosphate phosphatase [Candidatus Babeliales bacterium]